MQWWKADGTIILGFLPIPGGIMKFKQLGQSGIQSI